MSEHLQEWWARFTAHIDAVIILGLIGQAVFTARFVVQWIASERAGRSVIPVSFWWISLGGAALLFCYALLRADPVWILAQSFGFIVYSRNLMLIRKAARRAQVKSG